MCFQLLLEVWKISKLRSWIKGWQIRPGWGIDWVFFIKILIKFEKLIKPSYWTLDFFGGVSFSPRHSTNWCSLRLSHVEIVYINTQLRGLLNQTSTPSDARNKIFLLSFFLRVINFLWIVIFNRFYCQYKWLVFRTFHLQSYSLAKIHFGCHISKAKGVEFLFQKQSI